MLYYNAGGTLVVNDEIRRGTVGRPRRWLDMIKRCAAIAVFIVSALTSANAQDAGWQSYRAVAGIRVDLPLGLLDTDAGTSDDGSGHRFRSADQSASVTIQTFANANGDSPAQFLAQRNPPTGIVYRRVTPRFFVVSSYRGGNIWYNRCNFARRTAGCLSINYPASQKRQWDALVTRISRTLRVS